MPETDTADVSSTSSTEPSEARLVCALLSVSKSTRALTRIKLAERDFHNGQDELLLALDEEAAIPVSKLADELKVRPSTVSKMLERLVRKGLVERSVDQRNHAGRWSKLRQRGSTLAANSLKCERSLRRNSFHRDLAMSMSWCSHWII